MVTFIVSHSWWPPQSWKGNIQMCVKTTFSASLLLTLYFQQFWKFFCNVQYPAIHYPSCLCMVCVRVSGQVQSRDPAGLSSSVQMRLCLPGLLGSDQSAKPPVFLLCVCISVTHACVCVCVCRREWDQRMPALPRTAQLHITRGM